MKGKFKILCTCLLVVSLSHLSNGFWRKPVEFRRPLPKCSGSRDYGVIGLWRNKGCGRTPIIPKKPKLSTTMKPRALANPVVSSVPYCKSSLTEHDVSAILGRRSLRTQPNLQLRVGRRRTKRAVSIAAMP